MDPNAPNYGRAAPAVSVTHQLVLPQPWAWALLAGELEVANCDYPPQPSLLGTRIGIVGGPLWEAWWLLEGLGIRLRREDGEPAALHRATGWLGTVELVGYLRSGPGKKILEQVRPGDETPFRTRKGLLGPVGWILRKPKLGEAVAGARTIRAHWEDSKAYREQLTCYADQHGCAQLSGWHQETLAKMGYRAPVKVEP